MHIIIFISSILPESAHDPININFHPLKTLPFKKKIFSLPIYSHTAESSNPAGHF